MSAPFNDRGPFAVGELCIVVGAIRHPEFNGTEIIITSVDAGHLYGVNVPHPMGGMWRAKECNLRRKRPPTAGETLIRSMFDKTPVRAQEPA